jgi:hypothetical protein
MPNLTIALRVTQSYRSPVPPGALDELAPLLAAHGRPDGSEMLRGGGEVLLQLYADAELLGAMCNDLISPWRLIRAEYMPPDGEPRHDLGYRPPPVRTTDPSLPLFRQLGDDYLMQQPDGSWRSAGWAYRIIGKYVEQYWTVELTQPGSYRRRIGRFRDAVHTAPAMPPGTRVALTPANARTEYTRSRIDKILAMSPRPPDGAPLEVMPNSENLYDLCNLDPACAVWILPGSSPPDLPSAGQPSPA